MAEIIEVTIDEAANTEIKVSGVAGSDCEKLTEDLERALGKTTERKHTSEYHQKKAVKTATATR